MSGGGGGARARSDIGTATVIDEKRRNTGANEPFFSEIRRWSFNSEDYTPPRDGRGGNGGGGGGGGVSSTRARVARAVSRSYGREEREFSGVRLSGEFMARSQLGSP